MNISRLRRAYQATRSRIISAPQLCIAAIHPQISGEDPITTHTMTIPEQIQTTRDTPDRKMERLSGNALFYGALSLDATGPVGVTMHPHRHFTETPLLEYHPVHSLFDTHAKQRVIQVHCNIKYLVQLVPVYSAIQRPWQLKLSTDTIDPIPQILPQISRIPGSE